MARSKPPLELYHQIIDDRPKKLTEEEVGYRQVEGRSAERKGRFDEPHCGNCIHYYEREVDGFGVCELMRPDSDESVNYIYVCDFFTRDGEDFPLLGKHEDTDLP